MNNILKIISIIVVVMTLVSGCTSQSSPTQGQNFDQLKAAKTRVSLGLTYLKNGNFSQAKFNLDKALEFAPRSADANFAMAYYYQSVSELEQAEKTYQFAMDLDPKNADIANSYGAFLCQNGDYEKAKTYFLKAVNTSSYVSSAETYENLAMCSQNQGRPEEAIQYLRSAINHQPGRASSLYILAQTLVETQQWQEAREILRRYEKVSQISPQSLSLATKIEQGTGNDAAAKGYLDMMLRIFPNDPITQSAYAEHKQSVALLKKTENYAALVDESKVEPKLVESQATQLPTVIKVVEAENPSELIEETNVEPEMLKKPEFHVVAKGDNLYRISLLYNIKMQRLIEWNALGDEPDIYVGKKLSIVAPSVVE